MSLQQRTCVFFACFIAALSIPAFGQSTSGELVGTIYDQAGAVVPNATVVANNTSTGASVKALSTTSGQYRISNLPVGSYKLEVTATGFTKVEVSNLSVELNRTITTNVTLQVGQAVIDRRSERRWQRVLTRRTHR